MRKIIGQMFFGPTAASPAFVVFLGAWFAAVGCTSEKNASSGLSSAAKSELTATQSSAVNPTLSSMKSTATNVACSPEELAVFDRTDGEVVDLALETLPRGLFLARGSEMLVEKKNESGTARAIVREAMGSKPADMAAELACADGLEKFSPDAIDIAVTGLVKFDTSDSPTVKNITQRQFFFYQDKTTFGAIISNPKSLANAPGNGWSATDLRKLLASQPAAAQLVRLSERAYILKYVRTRETIRARLQIHLDFVQ